MRIYVHTCQSLTLIKSDLRLGLISFIENWPDLRWKNYSLALFWLKIDYSEFNWLLLAYALILLPLSWRTPIKIAFVKEFTTNISQASLRALWIYNVLLLKNSFVTNIILRQFLCSFTIHIFSMSPWPISDLWWKTPSPNFI